MSKSKKGKGKYAGKKSAPKKSKTAKAKKAKHRGRHKAPHMKAMRCSICDRPFIGGAKGLATHMKRRHKGAARKPRKKSLHGGRWVKTKAGRKKSYSAAKVLARYQRMKAAHAKKAAARARRDAKRTAPGKRKFHPFRVFAKYKKMLAAKKKRQAYHGLFSGLGDVAKAESERQAATKAMSGFSFLTPEFLKHEQARKAAL